MNVFPWGQCTWWVAQQIPAIQLLANLGNAMNWTKALSAHGWGEGTVPRFGAVACYQPGAQIGGPHDVAESVGHVAYVTAVNADGTFTISEMDDPTPGVEDSQTVSIHPGLTFSYPPEGTEMSSQEFQQLQTELDQLKQATQAEITQLQQEQANLVKDTQAEIQQLQAQIAGSKPPA